MDKIARQALIDKFIPGEMVEEGLKKHAISNTTKNILLGIGAAGGLGAAGLAGYATGRHTGREQVVDYIKAQMALSAQPK
jgi:hypothetical protein